MEVRVIADSLNPKKERLTTLYLKYPRFIHAEFLTHRIFSRNSSSSRAVSFGRQLKDLEAAPFIPQYWPQEQKGMQAKEYITDPNEVKKLEGAWLDALKNAIASAKAMEQAGLHKQIINRILEPFSWIHTIVTATDWENFFLLRCSDLAEPHMEQLADRMRDAIAASNPVELAWNEWHTPFASPSEKERSPENAVKVSASRCARVCYKLAEKDSSLEEDLALYDKLSTHKHLSPFEHQACALEGYGASEAGRFTNFSGDWKQLRKDLELG